MLLSLLQKDQAIVNHPSDNFSNVEKITLGMLMYFSNHGLGHRLTQRIEQYLPHLFLVHAIQRETMIRRTNAQITQRFQQRVTMFQSGITIGPDNE